MKHTYLFIAAAALWVVLLGGGVAHSKLVVESDDGKYQARFMGLLQQRFTFERPGTEDALSRAGFALVRARFKVKGSAFTPGFTYAFQADFGKGAAKLKDFYVQWFANPAFGVLLGQAKMPFSRQLLTSGGSQAFVDRAFILARFGAGRDIGVMLLSEYSKLNFEWALGVYNGTGEGTVPEQLRPTIVARAGYHTTGMRAYHEADLEGGGFRWAVGGNAKLELDMKTNAARDETLAAGADFMIKVHGFSANGSFFMGLSGPTVGDLDDMALGAHLQAGYVIDRIWMPGLRFATYMPEGADNDVMELQGGLSVFVFGSHSLKWQTDITAVVLQVGDPDLIVRSQIQLAY